MNKKLLALAVAAALAPVAALADGSTVTLTGVINGSYENIKLEQGNTSQTESGIRSNATRWNINGSEDLGDGLKAIFSLAMDQGFAGGTGTNNVNNSVANRNSFIGLAGDSWGSLKLGQNEHDYEIATIKQDPFPASENRGTALTINTSFGSRFNPGAGFTRRDPQSIWYATPDWSGFQGSVAYITPHHQQAPGVTPSGLQLNLQYTVPGVGLTGYFGYASYKDWADSFANSVAAAGSKDKAWHLGVGYTIADLTLNAQYESMKEDGNAVSTTAGLAGATGIGMERKNYLLSADYRIGPGSIKLLYEKGKKVSGNVCTGTLCDNTEAKLWTIGYWHDISKRTSLYINYFKLDNGNNGGFGCGDGLCTGVGLDSKGFALGMRTTF